MADFSKFLKMKEDEIKRNINISIINDEYRCTSFYKIPKSVMLWSKCPKCNLYPLVNEFDNGSYTGCGCINFSIHTESIMSNVIRNNGSVLYFDSDNLRKNWNHWVKTGEDLEPRENMLKEGKW
jgi:hypothetical protein